LALGSISQAAELRPIRSSEIKVLDYLPSSSDPTRQLAMSGTITLFLAPVGSSTLHEIESAVTAGDGGDIQLADRFRAQSSGRTQLPLEIAVEMVKAQSVFADVRYGGLTVASNYFVPANADYCAVVLPYNGGRLSKQGFSLIEHYLEDNDRPLQALALRHCPPLTPAEKVALVLVPATQMELTVGKAYMCWALSAIALVALVTLVAICAGKPGPHGELQEDVHLTEEQIRALGPAATARQLLQLRRQKLEESISRSLKRIR